MKVIKSKYIFPAVAPITHLNLVRGNMQVRFLSVLLFGWNLDGCISVPLFSTVHICLAMQCNFGCHLSHSLASMHYGKVEKCGKKIANFDHLFLHRFWPKSMHLLSFASLILDDFTYCKINCWTQRQVVHRPCISPNFFWMMTLETQILNPKSIEEEISDYGGFLKLSRRP